MTKTVEAVIVGSKLDCCNMLLLLKTAKNAENSKHPFRDVARKKCDHITPVLKELHWLYVSQRIAFKIAKLTYKTKQSNQPEYLAGMLQEYELTRELRSARLDYMTIPRSQTEW